MIKDNVYALKYKSVDQFEADMKLLISNALQYYSDTTKVCLSAVCLAAGKGF